MAKFMLQSEKRKKMLVTLRDMSRKNFLRISRRVTGVSTSNSLGCQYSES